MNTGGETPLHSAAQRDDPEGRALIQSLIAEGADVNAKNKWYQTPLHFAAIAESPQNIETLLNIFGIDVNIRDVNGYNALQCLIAARDNNGYDYDKALEVYTEEYFASANPENIQEPVDHSRMISDNLRRAIDLLVDAGTDLNNETVFGYGILHLAANRKENTALFKYFITNFPDINIHLTDKMGQNFVHAYDNKQSFEETFEFFSWMSELNNSSLKTLLSSRNVIGVRPLDLMISSALTLDNLKRIVSYGVSVEANDNFGNTVIHRASDVSVGTGYVEVLEYLVTSSVDINAKNIYGEPALWLIADEESLDVFLSINTDWNIKNRWGRGTLISMMRGRPCPDFLIALIEKGQVDINARDVYGSTPLHFAAYQNYPEQIDILLDHGADKNVMDDLQERPFDTARRHRSFQCLARLKSDRTFTEEEPYSEDTVLYTRTQPFEDILQEMPMSVKSSSIQTPQDIKKCLGLPRDLKLFMNNLMESYYSRNPKYFSEVEAIVSEVNNLVTSLCQQIGTCDSRFEMTVFPSGSMAEGTKIDRPDEFDFILCLNKLNDATNIVTDGLLEPGFASLKFKQDKIAEEYLPFTDADGYFLPALFLQYFFKYLQKALYECNLWKSGNLYYNFENKYGIRMGKPVFTFDVFWFGSVHKQLKISIDLVPAVHKKDWWPANIDLEKIPVVGHDIRAGGCFLTLQAKLQESFGLELQDCVSRTCNTGVNKGDYTEKRMLRISVAPAEMWLMKSLPDNFRHGYVLAKILKNVCPEIDVETKGYKLEPYDIEYAKPRKTKPSELITSYMLKNAVFYVYEEELKLRNHSLEGLDVSQIAVKIYKQLIESIEAVSFAGYMHMRPYFMSNDFNVFKISKELSYNKTFILQLQREFCIKLILGMLNEQFPKECLATNMLYGKGRWREIFIMFMNMPQQTFPGNYAAVTNSMVNLLDQLKNDTKKEIMEEIQSENNKIKSEYESKFQRMGRKIDEIDLENAKLLEQNATLKNEIREIKEEMKHIKNGVTESVSN